MGVGYNANGQLADGTVDARLKPVQVVSDQGRPQLNISEAVLRTNGTDKNVAVYYDTLRIVDENKSISTIQKGDTLTINTDKITGVSSFNLLRESGYAPEGLTFSSVDESVATVSESGVVSAVGTGITYIIVRDKFQPETAGFFKLNVVPKNVNYIAYPEVHAGVAHTVALKADGTVWAWGLNNYGQLGINTKDGNNYEPMQVMRKENQEDASSANIALTNVIKIAVGSYHNLALTADGQVFAWGWGRFGQLGDGLTTDHNALVAMKVVGPTYSDTNPDVYLNNIIDIAAAGYDGYAAYSMALDIQGKVYTWGRNYYRSVEPHNTADVYRSVPLNITDMNSMLKGAVKVVSDSVGHTGRVLRSDGQVISWGYNNNGNFGNGTVYSSGGTTQANLGGKRAIYVKGGWQNAAAIMMDGTVMMWGHAGDGTLGIELNGNVSTPTVLIVNRSMKRK